jgi:hypothetical protein
MSNIEPNIPRRGMLDPATERAEFDAMMSGDPALTPEQMAQMEKRSRKMSAENNKKGRVKYGIGKVAAKIVSGGSARY